MQSIEERKKQNDVIFKTCYITCALYFLLRVVFTVVFFISKAYILAYISIGGAVIYALYTLLIKNKKYYFYAVGCGNEFLVSAILGIIFGGMAPGFYLSIIGISVVSFFTVYFSFKERPIGTAVKWTIMSALICLGLHIYCLFVEPYYALEGWTIELVFDINIIVVFSFIIGYLMTFTRYAMTLENKIKNESRIDQLTQISNRHDLFNYLESIKDKENYGLAIFDIDNFKKVNDTYGHVCGDYVLKEIANIAKNNSDGSFVSRYGGEEFIIIIRTEGYDNVAFDHVEKVRKLIENNDFVFDGKKFKITISGGIEQYHDDISNEKWIDLADAKLYTSKEEGKNKTTI